MATTPPMIGGADPTVLKSLETRSPTVARTSPQTVSATTGSATSGGSLVARGIAPQVSGNETTYNQATQTATGTAVTITSSTSNDSGDVVTVYNSNKAISVSAVNQTVNTYKVTTVTGGDYSNSNVATYLPTYTGNVGAGNVNVAGGVYTSNLSATGLASLTLLNVSTTANLGAVGNVKIAGGTSGQVLSTDGAGNLSWTNDTTTYGNANVANYLPTFTGNVGGNVFTGNLFVGSGANLTNIPAGNISGTINLANFATTANAVAGANVSGTVANANLAQYLNVSDVNNNFSYHVVLSAGSGDKSLHIDADDNLQYNPADGTLTATRVDATYFVGNLNYANGYLASNVVGLGNIATINLTGSTSNVLYGNGVFAPASGGGGGAAISNGTSYANVVASDGNVVIGVNNDNMTWTFATDRKIYGLLDEDVQLVAVDDGNGVGVRQVVVDNTLTELSRTRLEETDFFIQFDLDSSANSWRFDSGSLRPPTNGAFEQFDGNIRMYAMDAGSNPVASLQSVSNQNDPNIFTTIDATTTGANIKVYNGGSNSGVGYTWQFANDGRLTFPGTPRIDTATNNFEVQAAEAINFEANTVVNIYTDAGNTTYQWQFGDDGNLTLPANTFAVNYANGTQVSLAGTYGNSNVVSLLGTFGSNTISTTGNIAVGAVSASGKIGYASGSTVTQTTSRGNGVNINALAGTIITTSAAMVASEIDTFSVTNNLVDSNNDIVLAQIVSPNQGTYNCIANPALIGGFNNGFYINIVNISGFTTSDETITIRFMVIKAPNA